MLVGGPRFEKMRLATLNIPIIKGGTNSSHTYNLAISQKLNEG